jgi:hypothetical protein
MCRALLVTYKVGLDWLIGFIAPYTKYSEQRQLQRLRYSHTLQLTVTQALKFSVFTNRILATDLQQSHCHFKSHMKSSSHGLIPFLPLFCNCQFRRLDSIPLLPVTYPGRLASWNSTLHSMLLLPASEIFFITTLQSRRKHSPSVVGKACLEHRCIAMDLFDCCLRIRCRGNVFTDSLPSNKRPFWVRYSGFRASCHNILSLMCFHQLFGNDFPLRSSLSFRVPRPYWPATVSQLTRRCYATTYIGWDSSTSHTSTRNDCLKTA